MDICLFTCLFVMESKMVLVFLTCGLRSQIGDTREDCGKAGKVFMFIFRRYAWTFSVISTV